MILIRYIKNLMLNKFRLLNWIDYITRTSSTLETRQMETRFGMDFQSSSNLLVGRRFRFERLTEPFFIQPDQAIPPGDYEFSEYSIDLVIDRSRMLSGEARLATGDFFDGNRDSYRFLFGFRYGYHFESEVSWTHDDITLPSGDFSTELVRTRLQYSFNTRMFVNALIQYNSEFKEIRATPILGESHTETIYLWQWVINLAATMEPSSSQRQMEPHGIMEHLELKIISMELPTGIVLSLQ